ncbi:hypothetical protein [Nocardioides jensenii]|uniref:hypothetical protein n=1 Tax=Nocardioides jensenii TaxID=1843 RepID=UPI00082E2BB1|nr:hypothetical protein [Nocardioides jensenii]
MKVLDPGQGVVLPQAMWLCYSTIAKVPGLSAEEVLSLVLPDELRMHAPSDGAHAKQAMSALVEFGLVSSEDGLLSADPTDSAGFLRRLRRQLVCPPSDVSATFEGAPDLRSGLVWLMTQSPFVPLHWKSNVQVAMPPDLFTNDTRWNNFPTWATTLGFARPALRSLVPSDAASRSHVVADPTEAVLDAIAQPFSERLPVGVRVPIAAFMAFLRSELPVLPGHPSATYEGLDDDPQDQLAAVGLALNSAEARGVLTMGYQSDPTGVLALPDNGRTAGARYVSTIQIEAPK